MLTLRQVVSQIRSKDWFVTIDLKDAYFHVSIHPCHRKFLRFAFGGKAYQYRSSLRSSTLTPHVYKSSWCSTSSIEAAGHPILNYIDDWLILAQSEMEAARHRDVILAHMKQLGLKLNAKESVLSPVQRTTYLGVVWDSTMMQERNVSCSDRVVHVSQESVRRPVTHCQAVSEIAGSDGSCVHVIPYWPAVHETPAVVAQDQGIFPEGKSTSHDQGLSTVCASPRHVEETLVLKSGPGAGSSVSPVIVSDGRVSHRLGAVMSGRSARGLWSGRHLIWHIYCLEMLAVLSSFPPRPERSPCVGAHQQHSGGLLHHSPGGSALAARYTNWHTRSSCGPRTSSSYWEHYLFLGTWMWDQTYCRDRGRGPGNGCFTPRWWSRYGECFIR